MSWLLIEMGVAFAIGVFIVWWTWPRSRRDKNEDRSRKQGEGRE